MFVAVTLRPRGLFSSAQRSRLEVISYFQNAVYHVLSFTVANLSKMFFCMCKLVMLQCSPLHPPSTEAEVEKGGGSYADVESPAIQRKSCVGL